MRGDIPSISTVIHTHTDLLTFTHTHTETQRGLTLAERYPPAALIVSLDSIYMSHTASPRLPLPTTASSKHRHTRVLTPTHVRVFCPLLFSGNKNKHSLAVEKRQEGQPSRKSVSVLVNSGLTLLTVKQELWIRPPTNYCTAAGLLAFNSEKTHIPPAELQSKAFSAELVLCNRSAIIDFTCN